MHGRGEQCREQGIEGFQSCRSLFANLRKMLSDPIFKGQIKLYIARRWFAGACRPARELLQRCSGKIVDRMKAALGGGGGGDVFPTLCYPCSMVRESLLYQRPVLREVRQT